MTEFIPPTQQQRYADTGRREISLLGRKVLATCALLKESDARAHQATHEIYVDRGSGMTASQLTGQVVDFDGTPYLVTKVMDPKASDRDMRGRYFRMLCTVATPNLGG